MQTSVAKTLLAIVALLTFSSDACNRDSRYEVIERAQKEVPNFMREGTHTEVDYVLLRDGHKIYVSCDAAEISNLDPTATCGFRPLGKYDCTLLAGTSLEKSKVPLSDLRCKDADGHNVYLYATKKE